MHKRFFVVMGLTAMVMASITAPLKAQFTPPDILSQIHEDSALAVIVPNLKTINDSLAKFLPAVGADMPQAKAPIASLLGFLGAGQGVDMNGSAALVMPTINMGGQPSFFLILPIDSEEKFMGNFQNATDAPNVAGMKQITTPTGQPGFVKFSGKYAILSDQELTASQHAPATDGTKLLKAAGQIGKDNFARHDLLVYVNIGKVGPMFNGLAAMGLTTIQMQIMNDPDVVKQMGGNDAVTAIFRMYGTLLSNILLQSDALVIGARANENGADLTYSIQFKADSPPAKVFAKTSKLELTLDRLPTKPFLGAIAMDAAALDWGPCIKALAEIKEAVDPASPIAKLMDAYAANMEVTGMINLAEFAWYAPPAGKPEKLLDLAYVYSTDDPAAAMTQSRKATQKMSEAYNDLAQSNGQEGVSMTYKENATTLGGKNVDSFSITMDPAQIMGPMDAQQMPKFLMGMLKGFDFKLTQTPNALVMASGQDTTLLAEVLKTTDGSGKLGQSETIAKTRKHLPPSRFMEGYVDMKAIMAFAMDAAKASGENVPEDFKIPEMSPVGISASSANGGVSATMFVPIDTIKGFSSFWMMASWVPGMENGQQMQKGKAEGEAVDEGPQAQ